jgi:hypothetical protein
LLACFIRNHYREAIETVRSLSAELAVLKPALNLSDEDFQRFLSEELTYLNSIQQPPPHEQLCVQYVQILDEFQAQLYILPTIYVGSYLTLHAALERSG